MAASGARFLVDKRGKKKAVVLDVKQYNRLISRLEELEDALELDEAVRTSNAFRDYREIREELSREGLLCLHRLT